MYYVLPVHIWLGSVSGKKDDKWMNACFVLQCIVVQRFSLHKIIYDQPLYNMENCTVHTNWVTVLQTCRLFNTKSCCFCVQRSRVRVPNTRVDIVANVWTSGTTTHTQLTNVSAVASLRANTANTVSHQSAFLLHLFVICHSFSVGQTTITFAY